MAAAYGSGDYTMQQIAQTFDLFPTVAPLGDVVWNTLKYDSGYTWHI